LESLVADRALIELPGKVLRGDSGISAEVKGFGSGIGLRLGKYRPDGIFKKSAVDTLDVISVDDAKRSEGFYAEQLRHVMKERVCLMPETRLFFNVYPVNHFLTQVR